MFSELAPGLQLIIGENSGKFPYCNGLLVDSEVRVLVDAGFGRSRREKVLAGGDIDIIINTHYHLDHAYANKFFPNSQVWAHYLDAPAICSREGYMAYTGLGKLMAEIPQVFPGGMKDSEVVRELSDGEVLDFGNIVLQVIHTPGHTPGHIALFEPEHRILFSGDIDLSAFGPWYGNTSSDLDDFTTSVNKLIALNPKILVTGHTGLITDEIPEKLEDFATKLNHREELILKHLRHGKTIEELVDYNIIHPRYPEPQSLSRFFEQTMLEKHLQSLLRKGKVVQKANGRFKASY